ncbi:hypothetical protein SCREM1_90 [Synechococcus phage S-CREM1]|nr:hypothetical protein SCREM1_90 [Synechococcus phage S-CREM1]
MNHFTVIKLCDKLQDARDILLELDESEDSAMLELLYQKYITKYHEYFRR